MRVAVLAMAMLLGLLDAETSLAGNSVNVRLGNNGGVDTRRSSTTKRATFSRPSGSCSHCRASSRWLWGRLRTART